MGKRAPRMAGRRPPIRPISTAQTIPRTSNSGVTAKAKATWLKLCQFMVAASRPLNAKSAIQPNEPANERQGQ